MGEARQRQYSKREFLQAHTRCIYCGGPATTTDHCPPRCFFLRRSWPETFEYSACAPCNAAARLDEQALAYMVRVRLSTGSDQAALAEMEKLLSGIINNQPLLLAEWLGDGEEGLKRRMRDLFGRRRGDRLRAAGWGSLKIGPLTQTAIKRFMVRLGQSLYYRHTGVPFRGTLYTQHLSVLEMPDPNRYFETALSMAPGQDEIMRSGQSLHEQFSYRYNVSDLHETLYAIVRLSEQFIFLITAMGPDMAARFEGQSTVPAGAKTEIQLASS